MKDVQVSRCRIFYEKEGQDPRSLGAALAGKSIVEAVLGHRGSGKRDVKVLVKWADESAARWEPLANIRKTIAFVRYAQTVPEVAQYVNSRLVEDAAGAEA